MQIELSIDSPCQRVFSVCLPSRLRTHDADNYQSRTASAQRTRTNVVHLLALLVQDHRRRHHLQ